MRKLTNGLTDNRFSSRKGIHRNFRCIETRDQKGKHSRPAMTAEHNRKRQDFLPGAKSAGEKPWTLHLYCMCAKSLQWPLTLCDPMDCLWGFSRQEYWNGLPCPPPEDLPNPGIEPVSLTSPALEGRFFTTSATWKAPLPASFSLL